MYHVHPHLAHAYVDDRLDEMRKAAADSRRREPGTPTTTTSPARLRPRSITSKGPTMHPTLAVDLAFLHVHAKLETTRRAAGESRLWHQVRHQPRQGRR